MNVLDQAINKNHSFVLFCFVTINYQQWGKSLVALSSPTQNHTLSPN